MSAELVRRAAEELVDDKLFRSWINDLEEVIAERDARIRELEEWNLKLRERVQQLEAGATVQDYTPVNAPFEFTETPGTYVQESKPSEAEKRIRRAFLTIDAATIKDWEDTEDALRKAALGIFDGKEHLVLPGEVHNSNAK